ncbi:MAG: DNA cytosine methyltransferase [Lewinella sp.]|uniref:DNA cytosine methyltransferase n=1 Tax=Lewinella sp. TaxID=2004506 RepID=UPI003D6BB5F3
MKNKSKNVLQAVDFFCSAGGVTCGFKQAGIDVLGGIDIDEKCKETYEKNNDAKFLTADVSNLEIASLKKKFNIRLNQRNLIFIGCSPCQYYSTINTNKTKSKKTRLLLEDFQDFVAYYRPGHVFIENVPGFEKKEGSPINRFKEFLDRYGYAYDDKVLNAKNYGVAQSRKRYVLLASRINKKIRLPVPIENEIINVEDVIGNSILFPPIPAGHRDETDFMHTASGLEEINIKRIQATPHNGGDRRSWPEELQPDCYKNHIGHFDVYGRMSWNKPAPTITTRFNGYSNGRYGHPNQDRAISIREGAVLQSFPIDYKFYSSNMGVIAKMIGNAVPPEFAKRLALQFL